MSSYDTSVFPLWLQHMVLGPMPNGAPEAIRRCADAWADSARRLERTLTRLEELRHKAAAGHFEGAGGTGIRAQLDQQITDVRSQIEFHRQVAKVLYEAANQIELAQYLVYGTAVALLIQLAVDVAMANAPKAVYDRMQAKIAMQLSVRELIQNLWQLLRMFAVGQSRLSVAARSTVLGAAMNGVVHIGAQYKQVADGNKKDVDWRAAGIATAAGAAGGLAGAEAARVVGGQVGARVGQAVAPAVIRGAAPAAVQSGVTAQVARVVVTGAAAGIPAGLAGGLLAWQLSGGPLRESDLATMVMTGFGGGLVGAAGGSLRMIRSMRTGTSGITGVEPVRRISAPRADRPLSGRGVPAGERQLVSARTEPAAGTGRDVGGPDGGGRWRRPEVGELQRMADAEHLRLLRGGSEAPGSASAGGSGPVPGRPHPDGSPSRVIGHDGLSRPVHGGEQTSARAVTADAAAAPGRSNSIAGPERVAGEMNTPRADSANPWLRGAVGDPPAGGVGTPHESVPTHQDGQSVTAGNGESPTATGLSGSEPGRAPAGDHHGIPDTAATTSPGTDSAPVQSSGETPPAQGEVPPAHTGSSGEPPAGQDPLFQSSIDMGDGLRNCVPEVVGEMAVRNPGAGIDAARLGQAGMEGYSSRDYSAAMNGRWHRGGFASPEALLAYLNRNGGSVAGAVQFRDAGAHAFMGNKSAGEPLWVQERVGNLVRRINEDGVWQWTVDSDGNPGSKQFRADPAALGQWLREMSQYSEGTFAIVYDAQGRAELPLTGPAPEPAAGDAPQREIGYRTLDGAVLDRPAGPAPPDATERAAFEAEFYRDLGRFGIDFDGTATPVRPATEQTPIRSGRGLTPTGDRSADAGGVGTAAANPANGEVADPISVNREPEAPVLSSDTYGVPHAAERTPGPAASVPAPPVARADATEAPTEGSEFVLPRPDIAPDTVPGRIPDPARDGTLDPSGTTEDYRTPPGDRVVLPGAADESTGNAVPPVPRLPADPPRELPAVAPVRNPLPPGVSDEYEQTGPEAPPADPLPAPRLSETPIPHLPATPPSPEPDGSMPSRDGTPPEPPGAPQNPMAPKVFDPDSLDYLPEHDLPDPGPPPARELAVRAEPPPIPGMRAPEATSNPDRQHPARASDVHEPDTRTDESTVTHSGDPAAPRAAAVEDRDQPSTPWADRSRDIAADPDTVTEQPEARPRAKTWIPLRYEDAPAGAMAPHSEDAQRAALDMPVTPADRRMTAELPGYPVSRGVPRGAVVSHHDDEDPAATSGKPLPEPDAETDGRREAVPESEETAPPVSEDEIVIVVVPAETTDVSVSGLLRNNRVYRAIFVSNLITRAGDGMMESALPFIVLTTSGSVTLAGWAAVALKLPGLFFKIPAAYAADFFDPRRTIKIGQRIGLGATLIGAVLAGIGGTGAGIGLIIVAGVEGVASTFYVAATERFAMKEGIRADQRAASHRLIESEKYIAELGRPLGLAMAGVSFVLPYLANAASFVLNLEVWRRWGDKVEMTPRKQDEKLRGRLADLLRGFPILWRDPLMRWRTATVMVTNAAFQMFNMRNLVVLTENGYGELGIGMVLGGTALGGIVGGLQISSRLVHAPLRRSLPYSLVASTGVAVAMAASGDPFLLAAGTFGVSVIGVATNISFRDYVGQTVPDEINQRVLGTQGTVTMAIATFSGAISASIITATDVATAGWVSAGAVGLVAAGTIARQVAHSVKRGLRRIFRRNRAESDAELAEPDPETIAVDPAESSPGEARQESDEARLPDNDSQQPSAPDAPPRPSPWSRETGDTGSDRGRPPESE
ncbi:MFS transporter [Nocardia sp. NPDC019395]|uniref:MFS transporter n=1 Tax=Nocardia sp. NPDC019395 TaxID=3154686 RepID=UPI0033D0A427